MTDKLPSGWAWTTLEEVTDPNAPIMYGILQPGPDCPNGIRYVRPTEIVGDVIQVGQLRRTSPSIAAQYKRSSLKPNDLLLSIVGTIGKVAVIPTELEGANITQSSARIRLADSGMNRDFVVWALRSPFLRSQFDKYRLGTGVPRLNIAHVRSLKIPIAPLNEQGRVAAKLDELLERVNACRRRLEQVPRLLMQFRQSVLSAACAGELTADWRLKNEMHMNDWQKVALKERASLKLGKMLDKAKNVGEPTPYLRNINVRWFSFDLTDLSLIKATAKDIRELSISDGDLLLCEGGEPGRCAVWDQGETNLIFQKALHRVRLNDDVLPQWLAINVKNDADAGQLESYFTGTTIKHLTGQKLAEYTFNVPFIEEQQEIIKRVRTLLKIADRVAEAYCKAQEQLDELPQAILAKAFRGELVPHDYSDEPAWRFLNRVRDDRLALSRKPRGSHDLDAKRGSSRAAGNPEIS